MSDLIHYATPAEIAFLLKHIEESRRRFPDRPVMLPRGWVEAIHFGSWCCGASVKAPPGSAKFLHCCSRPKGHLDNFHGDFGDMTRTIYHTWFTEGLWWEVEE